MTTGLAIFSLADGGFSDYSTNAAGEMVYITEEISARAGIYRLN